ncbi:SpvB/TcaC N-terminal domain-containing protein [Nonomuraea zeae]|nr:SpvB/TcaC N-terminal domain-containing protein [Nonomuraea zeae]
MFRHVLSGGLVLVLIAAGFARSGPADVRTVADPTVIPAPLSSCGFGTGATTTTPGMPDHQEAVSPAERQAHTVAFSGAKVVVKPGTVRQPVSIGITALTGAGVTVPQDMTNVTGKAVAGFRFTPHPMQFAAPVEVTLPYDATLLTDDVTAQDLYTYFFDEASLCWQPLQRVKVDEAGHTVTSLTDHFTDMINAAVSTPEHPANESFDPNQLKGVQAADPGSKVNLIAPPQPGNTGDNRLSYPIEVPPGRLGLQPQLNVSYSSESGNGWMGVGWDLSTPSITIDTRWGVPRYAADKETETYLLNGAQLTPPANRGTPQPRSSEKTFHARVEGTFMRIVRHGSSPKDYTWECTDKSGVRWIYDTTLKDGAGNVYTWALREVRDLHGNVVRYDHEQVDVPGAEPGRNLYVTKITYSGHYSVTFLRDRDLGEPLRKDQIIDARGGFKQVTADLLRRIDVRLDDTLIRRYAFAYTTGAFGKTLLASIAQLDSQGAPFNKHDFSYYDDIRDAQGNYQAFSPAEWTSPSDHLSNELLNLTPSHQGDASALSAGSSLSEGAHLYLGVGGSPSKTNSVGLKVGGGHTSNEGVLALIDVDGDGLPDKVFRDHDQVRYRKNLSGPHGQTRFAGDSHPLDLPGILDETSNTLTLGVEGFPGGVAAQADFVNAFSTTATYFADVNGDGVSDLVKGDSVLFGRVGADGTPVYGVSGDTPVPVSPGHLETDGLFDFSQDRDRLNESFPLLDSVRRWVAPFDGTVKVEGPVKLASTKSVDGVRVAVQHEDAELWSATIGPEDPAEHAPEGVDSVAVRRGDRLYFRVQSVSDGTDDEVSWNPQVSYLGVADVRDVNGLAPYVYRASDDFTQGGRSTEVKVPLDGTMHLSGDVRRSRATTDDVTAVITADGTPLFQQKITGDSLPIDVDVPVQKGQTLKWRLQIDSPIDLGALTWTPEATYVEHPDIKVSPPYDVDMYPIDELTGPQGSFTVAAGGDLTIDPSLAFDFGTAKPSGRVVFTVKRRGALVAKKTFDVHEGVLTSPGQFGIQAATGDELFFDFSTLDPRLRSFLTGQAVRAGDQDAPSAFHSAAVEGAFPQPYRGWGAAGYNGARATQPIAQDDLVIDDGFGDQLPGSVDQTGFGQDPRVKPPKVVPFAPSPAQNRWGVGDSSWIGPEGGSSARFGGGSVDLPSPADLGDAVAVPRLSRSRQISLSGGIGPAGASAAKGDSTGQLDFMDMNGDRFPDVVSSGGIQYTDPTGGLGDTRGPLPDGAVRRTGTESGSISAGSAARVIATGRGYASPPGTTTAATATAGSDMPPLGIGGSLGASDADQQFDLLDLNGDALPDRVYSDGRVALNLGYRFGAPEPFRNPGPLNKGSGVDAGLNLGFNTDFYGFAGGVSYDESSTSSSSTLMDMNGDGLLDRVISGDPIKVGLNTGSGFEQPVEFRGSLKSVNTDANARLGAAAYFTFSICFLTVCVVVNPGGHASKGTSRTEEALRDLNGDGYADHVSSTKDDQLVVAENRTGRTNLLKTVARPLGGRLDFDYSRDGNTFGQPQSRFVLSRVAVDDGRADDGPGQVSTYTYDDGVYDRLEREFDGYKTVVSHEDTRRVTRTYRTDGHYTRGLVVSTVTADDDGHKFVETTNTYTLDGDPADTTATIFPALTRTDVRYFEGAATAGKSTFTTYEYDNVGNITKSFDAGDAGAADDVDTRIGYSACVPGSPDVIDVFSGGTLLRHRESTVDCATGDVTRQVAELADGSSAVTDLAYFDNGNLRTCTGPANRSGQRYTETYAYDAVVSTYVESVTDSFGFRSTSTHDLRFGLQESGTDLNQQTVRNTYDAAGRLSSVTGPYEASSGHHTVDFEYHPEASVPYGITRHFDGQAGDPLDTIDTITFTDGLDRVIQTKTDATVAHVPVVVVSGRVVYDALGRAVEEFFPVTEAKGPGNTTFTAAFDTVAPTAKTYDVQDRVTKVVLPDRTTSTARYGFGLSQFETVATDANGKVVRTYRDVRGQMTSIKDSVSTTGFGYDALGQRTSIVDDKGNTTTMSYDNFGRRTVVADPSSGRTETVYDLAGNPIKKINAAGAAVQYTYDFNRLSGVRYPIFTGNNVTYTYGGPGAPNNTANRIAAVVDGAGSVAREYGPLGELTKETRTVHAQGSHVLTFTTQYRYDTWNRVLDLTFPDGEVLTYHYDSGGQVDAATGLKGGTTYQYLKRLDYDKFGQRALADTGNGTRTQYTYDPLTRRLQNLRASLAQGTVFENTTYGYDGVGNLTSLQNAAGPPSSESFQYDDVYRLTHAQGTFKSDPYTLDLRYDSISNITSKALTHGKDSYTNAYTYGGAHAASQIGIQSFAYDANGNQISRNQQPRPRRQLIWDEDNRLACDHENVQSKDLPQSPDSCDNAGGAPNARYFYDDQGTRVVKDGAQFHVYPNQNYSTNGNKEYKHIYVGSTRLLTKQVEQPHKVEDRQFYAHNDHLGSTGYVTDSSGGLVETLKYIPGGETWVDDKPSQPVPLEFGGKELDDETGMYYFGARYYDPRTAAWQSADPALPDSGTTSLALSSYLYGNANPLRYTDPDGLSPASGSSGDQPPPPLTAEDGYYAEYSTSTGEGATHYSIAEDGQPYADYRVEYPEPVSQGKAGLMARFQRSLAGRILAKAMDSRAPVMTNQKGGGVQATPRSEAVDNTVKRGLSAAEDVGPGRGGKGGGGRLQSGIDPVARAGNVADAVGRAGFWAGLIHGIFADYETMQDAKAHGRTYSEEVEQRHRDYKYTTIFPWGFVIENKEYCPDDSCIQ